LGVSRVFSIIRANDAVRPVAGRSAAGRSAAGRSACTMTVGALRLNVNCARFARVSGGSSVSCFHRSFGSRLPGTTTLMLHTSLCFLLPDRAAYPQWHGCGEGIPRRRLGKSRCQARALAVAMGLGAIAVTAAVDSGVRRNNLNQPPRSGAVLAPVRPAVVHSSAVCRVVALRQLRGDALCRNVLYARGPALSWRVAARLIVGKHPSPLASLVAQRVRGLCSFGRAACPWVVLLITAGPITKLCAWGEEESGGHVL
jgi:hypothetical protein